MKDPKIVFIGGTGRCGTSVLCRTLGLHPQVATLPFEYRFIIDPDGLVDFYNSYPQAWSPYMADNKLRRLCYLLMALSSDAVTTYRYEKWNLAKHIPGYSNHVDELLKTLTEFSFNGKWAGSAIDETTMDYANPKTKFDLTEPIGDFIRAVAASILKKQKKEIYVEDNTWNILFAKELLELVPDAKIIHIFRNPKDVVASFLKQRWCPNDTKRAVQYYRGIMEHWFDVKKNLSRETFIEICFEDFVLRPHMNLKEICQFIGLPFDGLKTCKPDLSRHNIGRYKNDFSLIEQEYLESELKDIIEKLGGGD